MSVARLQFLSVKAFNTVVLLRISTIKDLVLLNYGMISLNLERLFNCFNCRFIPHLYNAKDLIGLETLFTRLSQDLVNYMYTFVRKYR